jgi:hypothetical protein
VEIIRQSNIEGNINTGKYDADYWLEKEAEYWIESDRRASERRKDEEARKQVEYQQFAKYLMEEERMALNSRCIEERFKDGDLSLTPKIDRDLKAWNTGY